MTDSLILEVAEFEHDVLTGIYSEETGRPQPLRFTIGVELKCAPQYAPNRQPAIITKVCGQLTAPLAMNHTEAAQVLRLETRFFATLARR